MVDPMGLDRKKKTADGEEYTCTCSWWDRLWTCCWCYYNDKTPEEKKAAWEYANQGCAKALAVGGFQAFRCSNPATYGLVSGVEWSEGKRVESNEKVTKTQVVKEGAEYVALYALFAKLGYEGAEARAGVKAELPRLYAEEATPEAGGGEAWPGEAHKPVSGAEWYEYYKQKYGSENVDWAAVKEGEHLEGVLSTSKGEFRLTSGYKGPSKSMQGDVPGMDWLVQSHLEAHSSVIMRQLGVKEGTLYLPKDACYWMSSKGQPGGCSVKLPKMLPEDAVLKLDVPGKDPDYYVGLPDD
jgi:hypothetical protein